MILWFVLKKPKDPCTGILPRTLQDGLKLVSFVLLCSRDHCQTRKEVRKMEVTARASLVHGAITAPAPSLNKVSWKMSYSISSKAHLERAQSTISLQTACGLLSPALGSWGLVWGWIYLISKYYHPSLGVSLNSSHLISHHVWPQHSSLPRLHFPCPSCYYLPFLTALKIILFLFPFPHGITTVRAHLERLSRWPWSRSSRHCFQTQSWLFSKHSLAFFTPRGIPFNLAGLKASCWTMTS